MGQSPNVAGWHAPLRGLTVRNRPGYLAEGDRLHRERFASARMRFMSRQMTRLLTLALLALMSPVHGQTPPLTPDIPKKFEAPAASYDYTKRDVMIPMRDGVKLHTVIVLPKSPRNVPIILTRTPYDA